MNTPTALPDLIDDLEAEQEALDTVVAELSDDGWARTTPSEGWTVAHQVAHLTYFDRAAATAITHPAAFAADREELFTAGMAGAEEMDRVTIGDFLTLGPSALLATWRGGRSDLLAAARGLSDGDRVEWYGPSMGAKSFVTARLMETWAHGQDVVDALAGDRDVPARPPTDRLRHIAQLGVITRGWSYAVRGATAPEADVRVELDAPSGASWTWGPDDAADRVEGGAEDFCLVVTQRRHVDDTGLHVTGDAATDWMRVAQAFAGGPTEGPAPGRLA